MISASRSHKGIPTFHKTGSVHKENKAAVHCDWPHSFVEAKSAAHFSEADHGKGNADHTSEWPSLFGRNKIRLRSSEKARKPGEAPAPFDECYRRCHLNPNCGCFTFADYGATKTRCVGHEGRETEPSTDANDRMSSAFPSAAYVKQQKTTPGAESDREVVAAAAERTRKAAEAAGRPPRWWKDRRGNVFRLGEANSGAGECEGTTGDYTFHVNEGCMKKKHGRDWAVRQQAERTR